MSLSKIFKSPSSVIFQDIVALHPISDAHATRDDGTDELSYAQSKSKHMQLSEIHQEKQHQAMLQQHLDKYRAQLQIEANDTLQQQLKTYQHQIYESIQHEVNQYYENLHHELLVNTQTQVQALISEIEHFKATIHTVAHDQILDLSVMIAEKIIQTKVSLEPACLSTMILDAIQSSEHLNIQTVELSSSATELMQDLKERLKDQGISLIQGDYPLNHVVLNGEIGQYDVSVSTQLNNAKRVIKS